MHGEYLGGRGVVCPEADAYERAELRLALARHAQLEVVGAALQGQVGHEKSSGALMNNAAELLRFEQPVQQNVQQPAEQAVDKLIFFS